MATLELTDDEVRVLSRLLKKAGNQASNSPTHDFSLRSELLLSVGQATTMAPRLRAELAKTECVSSDGTSSTDCYFADWLLFRHFERKVSALIEKVTVIPSNE